MSRIDEYGFIVLDAQEKAESQYRKNMGRKHGIGGVGRGNHVCKHLCKYLPKVTGRTVSFSKHKKYFCSTCEKAMGCARCRCCGSVGRSEPRGRHGRLNKLGVKSVE